MDTNRFLAVLRRLDESRRFVNLSSEQVLVQFAAARDEAALRELIARHGRHVWAVCRHEAGCPGLADDAFQSVFLALNQHAGSIRRTGSLACWLDKTARRSARRLRHSQARRAELESIHAALPAASDETNDAERRDLADAVRRAVAELPERYRLPVIYRYLNDLPPPEIAKLLGLSEGTVKTQLNRGLKVLGHNLASRGLGAGATAAAIEGTLAGVAEAVPPAVAAAAVKNVVGAPAAAGGLTAIWLWLTQAKHSAMVGLAGLGLAGGIATVIWPNGKPTATSAEQPRPIEESDEERSLRLFHRDVLPEIQDALRNFVLGERPPRVVHVRFEGDLLACLLEGEHRLGSGESPWFRSCVNLVFNPRSRALLFNLDQFATGEFRALDPRLPIRFVVAQGLGEKEIGLTIPSMKRVWSAYDVIPGRPPEPLSLRGAAIRGWTDSEIEGFRTILGRWYFQGSAYLPSYIYLDDAGRCIWLTEHLHTLEMHTRARATGFVIKNADIGAYGLNGAGRLAGEGRPDIWYSREPLSALK